MNIVAAAPPQPPLRVMMTADAVGGIWVFACELARELAERGCQVNLVTLGPTPGAQQLPAIADCPGVTLTITDLALEWTDKAGRDVSRAREVLAGIANIFGADVVHVNGFREALSPFPAPTLITAHSDVRSWWLACHGCEPPAPEWRSYIEMVKCALDTAHAWTAPTEAHRRLVQKLYRPRTSGMGVWNGVSLHAEEVQKESFVLAAGRLWDLSKGVETLARAASGIDWPVKIVGPSSGFDCDGAMARGGAAELTGELSRDQTLRLMARATVFVSPAVYEPFGLGVLEAAASGCALVLSDIPTFRELWGDAALFFSPGDSEGLTEAVNRLCQDDGLRRSLGWKARTRAQRYPIGATADAYLALYGKLTGSASVIRSDAQLVGAYP